MSWHTKGFQSVMKIAWFFFLVLITKQFSETSCNIFGNKLLWQYITKNIHWEEERKNAWESLSSMEEEPRENFTNQKGLYIFSRKI